MNPTKDWKLGDRVVHAGKPEWGVGEVRSAESVTQDGRRCQRLTLRFERAGVKTLSTAFADLRTPEELGQLAEAAESGYLDGGAPSIGDAFDAAALEQRVTKLPESATDPFIPKRTRLKNTLALYRFSTAGAALLDWAAAQTGMKDPLSRFSRHDLERLFERFRINLDNHLKRLAPEVRKEDPGAIAELMASAPAAAVQAMRRLDVAR